MWREAVLPARPERGPLHSVVGGVCRNRHSFRGGPPHTAKHSRFGRSGGEHPRVDEGLSTGFVETKGRGCEERDRARSVYGLEACRDEGHKILELRIVAVLQLAVDLVDAVDDGGMVAAAETGADLRQ
jgi:hypothetical protein